MADQPDDSESLQFEHELTSLLDAIRAFEVRWRSRIPRRRRTRWLGSPTAPGPAPDQLRREYEAGASVADLNAKYGVRVRPLLKQAGTTFRPRGRRKQADVVRADPAPPLEPPFDRSPKASALIARGVVAYLDTTKLNHAAASLRLPPSPAPDGEARPFVCVSTRPNGTSVWAPITSQARPYRLELLPEWLIERTSSFLQGGARNWLNGSVYEGDDEAFIDAELPGDRTTRNRFGPAAMMRIDEAVRAHAAFEKSRLDYYRKRDWNFIHDRREAAGR